MKRLLATACLALAVVTGTSFVPAQAADNGVGRSDSGSTGQERACEVHAENKGKGVAKGLDCAPPATLVHTGPEPFAVVPGWCLVTFTGSGLAPGTFVTETAVSGDGETRWVITLPNFIAGGPSDGSVDASGNFYSENIYHPTSGPEDAFTVIVSATTASGETITTTFLAYC